MTLITVGPHEAGCSSSPGSRLTAVESFLRPNPCPMTEQRGRISSIDALRGIAALAVAWFHLTHTMGPASAAVQTDEAAIAAAAALIALVGAMGGATVAARRRSDRGTMLPVYFRDEQEEPIRAAAGSYHADRDEPTILPPTH